MGERVKKMISDSVDPLTENLKDHEQRLRRLEETSQAGLRELEEDLRLKVRGLQEDLGQKVDSILWEDSFQFMVVAHVESVVIHVESFFTMSRAPIASLSQE